METFGHSEGNDPISVLAWHLLRVVTAENVIQGLTVEEFKQVLEIITFSKNLRRTELLKVANTITKRDSGRWDLLLSLVLISRKDVKYSL